MDLRGVGQDNGRLPGNRQFLPNLDCCGQRRPQHFEHLFYDQSDVQRFFPLLGLAGESQDLFHQVRCAAARIEHLLQVANDRALIRQF